MSEGIPRLDSTFGTMLIGVISSGCLWGASCTKTWIYFTASFNDPKGIKALVLIVFLLDTLHQILISQMIYVYLISGYGDPVHLEHIVWSLPAMVFVSCFICLFVQSFFTWRIWLLSHKNFWVVAFVMIFVLAEFVITFAYFVTGLSFGIFTEIAPNLATLTRLIGIAGACGNFIIGSFLIFYLQKSKTGFSRSDKMLNKLIIFSVNTGLLTSLCEMMSAITFSVFPTTFIYIMLFMVVSRLYTHSLLSTLNGRRKIRDTFRSVEDPISPIGKNSRPLPNLAIQVSTEVEVDYEGYRIPEASRQHDYGLSIFTAKETK